MDFARLGKRYDRLWSKAERLVETFLKRQLEAAKADDDGAAMPPMREVYIAVQCLKRIYEGRLAALTGGDDALQPLGSSGPAKTAADEISRRIQEMLEHNGPSGDDEDQV